LPNPRYISGPLGPVNDRDIDRLHSKEYVLKQAELSAGVVDAAEVDPL
jgi:hypothetical protein